MQGGQREERGGDAEECRCPQETGSDICGSTKLLWGEVEGEEWRVSSELWGEGCDHSVIGYYCHNAYTHTHTLCTHVSECVQIYRVEILMYDTPWQP